MSNHDFLLARKASLMKSRESSCSMGETSLSLRMTRCRLLDWAHGRRTSGFSKRLDQLVSQTFSGSNMPSIIDVGHDDHDLQFLELRLGPTSIPPVVPVVDDADDLQILELRLGPTSVPEPASLRVRPDTNTSRDRIGRPTIDLNRPSPPSYDEDCILVNKFVPKKGKHDEPPQELKLTCAICMDSMKEETSTLCGHLFCRGCILQALAVQTVCPTCRRRLTAEQTHRIYISGCL